MKIESLENGIVIDHIRAGFGVKVLEYLGALGSGGTIAFIMNAVSQKHGRKDIIKLDTTATANINLDVLGLIDHNATIIEIRDFKIIDKKKAELPDQVTNVILCKNPRCVTSSEQVAHTFHRVGDKGLYRCGYCDDLVNPDRYFWGG